MLTAEEAMAALAEEVRHEPALEVELCSTPGASAADLARLALRNTGRVPGQAVARVEWLGRSLDQRLAQAEAPEDRYALACRSALVHGLLGHQDAAFEALRAAAAVNDRWARHHHLYGLLHAVAGEVAEARFELGLALEREPFAAARERIAHLLQS